jgi:hypothetical protein
MGIDAVLLQDRRRGLHAVHGRGHALGLPNIVQVEIEILNDHTCLIAGADVRNFQFVNVRSVLPAVLSSIVRARILRIARDLARGPPLIRPQTC